MKSLTICLLLLFPVATFAKRKAPTIIPKIKTEAAIYSAPHFVKDGKASIIGGLIEAHHSQSNKRLWRVRLYKTKYNLLLEMDVQDVYITSMKYDKAHHRLIISDENKRVYHLDLETRKVTRPTEDNGK